MNFYLKILLLLNLISTPLISFSALDYNSNIENAHDAILDLDFKTAQKWLKIEKEKNHNNTYVDYLKSYQSFLQVYFKMRSSDFENFMIKSDVCLGLLAQEKNISEAAGLAALVYIQKAFIHFLWNESFQYAKAYINGQSELEKMNPLDYEYSKIASLYEVIGASIPNAIKPIAKLFDYTGNRQKGLDLIQNYLNINKSLSARQTEGQIIQLYIHQLLDLKMTYTDLKPESALLLKFVQLQNQTLKASTHIKAIDQLKKENPDLPAYFTFIQAKAYLNLQDSLGLNLMDEYINKHEGLSLKHTAHFYKFWYYSAHQLRHLCELEKQQITNLPDPLFPLDKKMSKRITQSHKNEYLIKSRMLFDAHAYQKALITLKEKQCVKTLKTEADKLEFLYRMARIYEKLEESEKVIKLYTKVIESEKSEYYFVPYSAYNLGKYYAKANKKEMAKTYFLKALDLNKGEYQQSIENKCNFALELLEQ